MSAAGLAVGALGAAAVAVLVARRGFTLTTVDGASMEPALRSGSRILVRRTRRARRGQVVLFRNHLDGALLLKRAVAVQGDRIARDWADPDVGAISGTVVPRGSLVVLGDNRPASWDSRHFGFVPRARLVGVMVRRVP